MSKECKLKNKVHSLFREALLGAKCLHYGKYIFEGNNSAKNIDISLGFSLRHHKKRTEAGYETIDRINFKNTYILLSTLLEEVYYLFQKESDKLDKDYRNFIYDKQNPLFIRDPNIRFIDIANGVRLISNVLKHDGGIVKQAENSGKKLIETYSYSEQTNLIDERETLPLGSSVVGDIGFTITSLYVFALDFGYLLFKNNHFTIETIGQNEILKSLQYHDIRKSFDDFIKTIDDGSISRN